MLKKLLLCLSLLVGMFSGGFVAQAQCSSGGTNEATTIEFVNQSNSGVDFYWLDTACNELYYGFVPVGETYSQQTYDQHEWVVRGYFGVEITRGVALAGQTVQVVIISQDRDGDGVEDFADYCPDEAGMPGDGCPDTDGDRISDQFDECPTEPAQGGCPLVTSATLPANLAPITAANAANLGELGFLRMGQSQIVIHNETSLLIPTAEGINLFDLSNPNLNPTVFGQNSGASLQQLTRTVTSQGTVAASWIQNEGTQQPEIIFWDMTTLTEINRIVPGPMMIDLALNKDGTRLATSHIDDANNPDTTDGALRVYDVPSGNLIWEVSDPNALWGVSFKPDGSQIVTELLSFDDPMVIIWDAETGAEITRATGLTVAPFTADGEIVKFSPDGTKLVGVSYAGHVLVMNTADYSVLGEIIIPGDTQILSLDFSPDSSLLAVGVSPVFFSAPLPDEVRAKGAILHLVDLNSNTLLTSVSIDAFSVWQVAFSGDGKVIVTMADSQIKFWGVPQ